MTSSIGNIFRVTGPFCREFTSPRWIPLTKDTDEELLCFLWPTPEQTAVQTIKTPVIKTPIRSLWRHCNYNANCKVIHVSFTGSLTIHDFKLGFVIIRCQSTKTADKILWNHATLGASKVWLITYRWSNSCMDSFSEGRCIEIFNNNFKLWSLKAYRVHVL